MKVKTFYKYIIYFLLISIIYFTVTLYKINEIPGEWFGDISIVGDYVSKILSFQWPHYFETSGGPAYPYIISPLIKLLGQSYLSYKVASIIIGYFGIIAIFLLAKEISSSLKIGFVSMTITSVSFWYIVWARIGNYNIIVPSLSSLTVYFSLKYIKLKSWKYLIFGILFSSIGLFTYPATFILPLFFIIICFYGFLIEKQLKHNWKKIMIIPLLFLPSIIMFVFLVRTNIDTFTNGFIGEKLFKIRNLSAGEILFKTLKYAFLDLKMLYFKGDNTFRYNVSGSPHLDLISGLFFLLGVLFWLKKEHIKNFSFILISLFLLSLPSIYPTHPEAEVPNIARTFIIFPFVIILVSSGFYYCYSLLKSYFKKITVQFFLLLFFSISYLNLNKYFVIYPTGLPDKNVPFGKIIAKYIDSLPNDTKVHLTSCCWGHWGQPEPKGIFYVLNNKVGRKNIVSDKFITSCPSAHSNKSTLFIFNPTDQVMINKFKNCFPKGIFFEYIDNYGQKVFSSLYLKYTK